MTKEAFQAAIAEAKKMEKKVLEYEPYDGEINIEQLLDLEPQDYDDLDYKQLSNLYERVEKIISTRSMGILEERGAEAPVSAESKEVESKLQEMTTERLKEAEELAKEPSIEKEEAPPSPQPPIELEREKIEIEKPSEAPAPKPPAKAPAAPAPPPALEKKEVEIPFKEEEPAKPPEAPAPKAVGAPWEAPKPPAEVVPPTLKDTPDEAAAKRYKKIEEQVTAAIGEGADELTLKKKMLELTKQLFKEKSINRKEEIKAQIKVLKNMSAAIREGKKKKVAATERQYDALLAAQQEELAHTKGKTIDSYNKQIMAMKEKFYEDMGQLEDADARKKRYEEFVSSVTMLVEGLPAAVKKEKDYVSKKHTAEMKKLVESLGPKERALRKNVEERIAYIDGKYDEEFSMIKHIVGREIENLIEVTGSEIFKKPEEKKKKGKKREPTEIVKEINETDEGTLLYFLHSKDTEYYKKFERKQISRAEAVFKAKELMAKEKGLSAAMIKKYFSVK